MLSNARVIRGSQFDILSGGLNNTLTAKLCQGLKQVRKESIDRLMGLTSNQKKVLVELREKVPSKVKWRLQEALKRSEHAHGRALLLKDMIP